MIRKLYSLIRSKLPENLQSDISRMIFNFSPKPFYKKNIIPEEKRFPNMEKGGLIISADFEMAWAYRYSKKRNKQAEKLGLIERDNIPVLLRSFEKFNIPVTWATVGHLFLEKCECGNNGKPHSDISRLNYFENKNWLYDKGDWFDCDPCSDYNTSPAWYAPDLIKQIMNSNVNHEIGCHTFSHIDFSDENCPQKVADDEIKACINVMSGYSMFPKSMVFPGGTWGNIKVLKKYGIEIYRKNEKFDLAYPYKDKFGLLVSPTTEGFGRSHHSWSADYYIYRGKKFIDKAIKTGTISHFWFHPCLDDWSINNVIPFILDYASNLRKQGLLWIGTMEQIANHISENKIC